MQAVLLATALQIQKSRYSLYNCCAQRKPQAATTLPLRTRGQGLPPGCRHTHSRKFLLPTAPPQRVKATGVPRAGPPQAPHGGAITLPAGPGPGVQASPKAPPAATLFFIILRFSMLCSPQ